MRTEATKTPKTLRSLKPAERETRALALVKAGSDLGAGPITFKHDREFTTVAFVLWDGREKEEMIRHTPAESFLLHGGYAWRLIASCSRADGMLVRLPDGTKL